MHPGAGILAGMLETYERYGHSVVALKEVAPRDISSYGCAAVKPLHDNLVQVEDLVEKPAPEEAPSNLAVMGRYVFGPEIFDVLAATKPGRGGEIQLTDAIKALAEREPVYGWTFRDGRFDVGNKLDWLQATVELALEREDIGPPFRKFLMEHLAKEGSRPQQRPSSD
jgi:UTP--glucose-1-phosphate uridylyltransferase